MGCELGCFKSWVVDSNVVGCDVNLGIVAGLVVMHLQILFIIQWFHHYIV